MNNINYIGEHLIYGQLGHGLIIAALVSALLAAFAYSFSTSKDLNNVWRSLGRGAFLIHAWTIISAIGLIFYLIVNHFFEFYYVWEHSSLQLPMRYIFSCFWEGQEGSFMLWAFWHVVLSIIIIIKGSEWESPVLAVVSMVQVFLCSMLLGVYVFGHRIGSDPFILLRLHPDMAQMPFVQMGDYLQKLKDGRGLNPLLQNYWMTIHPPTLFLGFASTLIPFAFAIAGLWKNKIREWVKPAMPWTFFGIMILGTGILMGAAWAYESLSFGGFWAWDPVENASFVPWIVLVAAGHLMLIYRHRGHSMLSTIILTVASFLLVLYSTFLTRSGILGNASVHAFTDLGMSGQLIIYMGFFVVLTIALVSWRWKQLPKTQDEENLSSREFWMFIGVLVLLISAFQITFETSKPVYNKLFGLSLAPPANIVDHYNKWQLPIAFILCILIAVGQFFRWKQSNWKRILKKLSLSFIAGIAITALSIWHLNIENTHHALMFFAATFAILANLDFLLRITKSKFKHSGSSIAHVGFAMILLGALIANGKKEIISRNNSNLDLGAKLPNNENVMLVKGDTVQMGKYFITYRGFKKDGVHVHYQIDYLQANASTGKFSKSFSLFPVLQLNERMGNAAEPDTRHFWNKDIYSHVSYVNVDDIKEAENKSDYRSPENKTMKIGDTLATNNSLLIFKGINKNPDISALGLKSVDLAIAAELQLIDINKKIYELQPLFLLKDQYVVPVEDSVPAMGMRIALTKIDPEKETFEFTLSQKKSAAQEFIVMKAIIFPYINLLWLGCVLMIIGSFISIRKRILQA